MNYFKHIGHKYYQKFQDFLDFSAFFYAVLRELLLRQVPRDVLVKQIYFTGIKAISIIGWISLVIGGTIIIQGMTILANFGQSDLVYTLLKIIITLELGPILTAFILTARSGTAIATELGNMVVNHEIEALISMGISPIRYLVIPRVISMVISLVCLTIFFNLFGLIGGYMVSSLFQPVGFIDYIASLMNKIEIIDLVTMIIKSLIFGLIISVISCYQGLKVNISSTEVPQVTIDAVVQSLTWLFIFNILVTIIYYTIS